MQGPARRAGAGRHHRRQDLGPARPRGARRQPRRENLAMIADSVAYLQAAGRRGDLRRRAFLRRLSRTIPSTPCRRSGRPRRPGRAMLVLCDTNGGTPARARSPPASTARAAALDDSGRHPLPQRLRRGGGQHAGRRRARARCRCRGRSTASANAAATPTWSASSPTWP